MIIYKCDRCKKEQQLNKSKVKDKQYYVKPHNCYGGDYYIHSYYWFACDCGRRIEVHAETLMNRHNIEKDYSEHIGACPISYNERRIAESESEYQNRRESMK